ncbi:MAG TPA: Nif3-like dinuclear metal center hexameric protein [Spirochaetota bacterium]|nr:Nif3-like dinuclear metal center hexameric protein [Spirochaetota bacterium]
MDFFSPGKKKRLKLLLENDIGLIAYHLPLDCHPEFGNNAQILKKIGISNMTPFGFYKGFPIGFEGTLQEEADIEDICGRLGISTNSFGVKYLSFGVKKGIKRISVVSGGGGGCFDEAINKGVDLYITGDAEHQLYREAVDNQTNLLFAGHYFTETFGIKAIQKKVEEDLGVFTIFCDIPTGL